MSYFHVLWLLLSAVGSVVLVCIAPVLQNYFGFVVNEMFVVGATVAIPTSSGLVAHMWAKYRDSQMHPNL